MNKLIKMFMLSMLVLCNLTFVKATPYDVIADGEYYESFELALAQINELWKGNRGHYGVITVLEDITISNPTVIEDLNLTIKGESGQEKIYISTSNEDSSIKISDAFVRFRDIHLDVSIENEGYALEIINNSEVQFNTGTSLKSNKKGVLLKENSFLQCDKNSSISAQSSAISLYNSKLFTTDSSVSCMTNEVIYAEEGVVNIDGGKLSTETTEENSSYIIVKGTGSHLVLEDDIQFYCPNIENIYHAYLDNVSFVGVSDVLNVQIDFLVKDMNFEEMEQSQFVYPQINCEKVFNVIDDSMYTLSFYRPEHEHKFIYELENQKVKVTCGFSLCDVQPIKVFNPVKSTYTFDGSPINIGSSFDRSTDIPKGLDCVIDFYEKINGEWVEVFTPSKVGEYLSKLSIDKYVLEKEFSIVYDNDVDINDNVIVNGPINLSVKEVDYKTVRLQWEDQIDANEYDIYRKSENAKKYKKVLTVNGDITGLKTGKNYSFYVVRNAKEVDEEHSNTKIVKTSLKGNLDLTVYSENLYKTHILEWNKIAGATRYIIYRKQQGGSYKKIITIG